MDVSTVTLDNIKGTHVYGQLARPKVGRQVPGHAHAPVRGGLSARQEPGHRPGKTRLAGPQYQRPDDAPIYESPAYYDNLKKTTLKDYVTSARKTAKRPTSFACSWAAPRP
ncbi:MAG: hypothetical protein WDO13_15775 [Verrucomicrobiota bacterium]